jgi:hypothetical protein
VSDIKPCPAGGLALTADNYATLAENPLLALPPALRPPVFRTWGLYRHLAGLETAAPIAFAAAVWVGEFGISPEAVGKALRELMRPERMRAIRFASDLTSTLAELVAPEKPRVYDEI